MSVPSQRFRRRSSVPSIASRLSAELSRGRNGLPFSSAIAYFSFVTIRPTSGPYRSGACRRSTASAGASKTIASQRFVKSS